METNVARFCRTFALGLVLAFAATACGERQKSQPAEQLPAEVIQLVDAMAAADHDAARAALAKIDRDPLPPAQRALVERNESQLLSVDKDYAGALRALERAVASGGLGPEDQLAARFDEAWFYAQLGQPAKAVETYRAWQEALTEPATVAQLSTMSEAYAAAHDCAGAAALIAKAYARVGPEDAIDVAAALDVVRPLCPDEPGLAKYGNLAAGSR